MDIHNIRLLLKMKSIYDIPLRVTYYARVSSESDEQLNSLGNQITYYEDLIKRNRSWTFVPGYIDEGLSGISTKKRENFNRMIEEAAEDKFDLVITKEISRFARNTLDSIQFTRQLLSYGVGVFFQNDNINTLDEDSELRLSIMSSIAQDELRKLSSRVKFGHAQAIKDGVVLGNNRIFGYQKDNGRLVIDEEEAPMVRELFELYATGEYSMKQIEAVFWNKGYRNSRGNRLSHTTMSNMISNPKYKGYYVGNKVKVIDMFTKKQKFLPPEEWVMFKDESGEIVPAIVSEELWEKANAILRKRSDDVKSRQGICNHANLLTGKLYCPCCGAAYYRRESRDRQGNKNSKWVYSGKIKNGADSCASFPIYEEEIKPLLFEVFKETEADAEAMLEEYMRMYQSLDNDSIQRQITAIEQKLDLESRKKAKLLDFNITGRITDNEYLQRSRDCEQEIGRLQKTLLELEQELDSKEDFRKHMESIREVMRCAQRDASQQIVSKEFIDKYIDRIFVTPQEDGSLRLEIKIFTGEATEKYLAKLKKRADDVSHTNRGETETCCAAMGSNTGSRTGHTFNMMWHPEAYQLLGERTDNTEKILLKSIFEELAQLNQTEACFERLDELFANPLKIKVYEINSANTPYMIPTGGVVHAISAEEEHQLLDEIGSHFLSLPEYDYGRVPDEKRSKLTNQVVSYLYALLQEEIASINPIGLYEKVCYDLETVMHDVMLAHSRYAYEIACYPEKADQFIEKYNEANKASVALKFLAEYIASVPPCGTQFLGTMQYDRILAICSLIIDWAYKNDLFFYNIFNTPVEFLKSWANWNGQNRR